MNIEKLQPQVSIQTQLTFTIIPLETIMSVLYSSEVGCFISHEKFVENVYKNVLHDGKSYDYRINENLFKINCPYINTFRKGKDRPKLKQRQDDKFEELKKEVSYIENSYTDFRQELQAAGLLDSQTDYVQNREALDTAQDIYNTSGRNGISSSVGENNANAICTIVNGEKYLFPKRCRFYCKNVTNIGTDLTNEKYDLILLDPPWWNKYIRRKRSKSNNAYDMMFNDDLKELPVEDLIKDDGIVAAWCTNSAQHLDTLTNVIFKKWNVTYLSKWYWLKVTKSGIPVCNFSEPPSKQPFEQIIFGCRTSCKLQNLTKPKLLVSVPSALHSHKPPLVDVLQEFLPEEPKCLEIFARYLLPNWTSYGLEAIRFQHEGLYQISEVPVI